MDLIIRKLMKTINFFICAVLVIQLTGCGTLMHPERRGQKGGRIDVGVALLDGIGLFFFLIPGIIAYAVDFSEGTIYLPGGLRAKSLDIKDMKQITFDPKNTTLVAIQKIIQEETGFSIKLDRPDMRITKLRSTSDMVVQFAEALPEIQDQQLTLSH